MSRRQTDEPWDVLVCRGCCCGSTRKHRGTDHEGQVESLRDACTQAGDAAPRVLVTDCLDRCTSSNVVVLRPPRAARKRGAKPVWLGRVLSAAQTAEVAGWLSRGGPAAEPLPATLQGLRIGPSGR